MKRVFEGCVQAKEISLTRRGANPHAHVLIKKTAEPAPGPRTTPAGDPNMPVALTDAEKAAAAQTAAIQKAAVDVAIKIAGMSDVTKAHFLGLADDARPAFLEKSADEQKTEAETAKAAADAAAAEAEAIKSGKSVETLAIEKRFAALEEVNKGLVAKLADADIEKRADNEFSGFPGGSAAVVPLLKAYAGLPDDVRKASEDLLKAQCNTAKALMRTFAGATEQDITKAAAAQTRLAEAAKKYAVDHKVTEEIAMEKISELREFAEDVAALNG